MSYSSDSAAFFAADMDVEDVQVHIDREAPLTGKDNFGRNLLMRAASEGRTDVVAQLLASGEFNVHEKSPTDGTTAMYYAAKGGHNDTIELLLKHRADVRTDTLTGETPLMAAIKAKHVSTAELLLSRGAPVNPTNRSGESAMSLAVSGNLSTVAQLLINRGATTDIVNKDGESLLVLAEVKGYSDITRVLLSNGCYDKVPSKGGYTALSDGIERGLMLSVEALLKDEADINLITVLFGNPLLHFAVASNQLQVVSYLLKRGASLSTKFQGLTALQLAVCNGLTDVAKVLLDNESSSGPNTLNGKSLLMIAARDGDWDMVELLLRHVRKADLDCVDESNGFTALHYAVSRGRKTVVKMLMQTFGVDAGAVSKMGLTASDLALDSNMLRLLGYRVADDKRPSLFQCGGATLVNIRDLRTEDTRPGPCSKRLLLLGSFQERVMATGETASDVVLKFASSSTLSLPDEIALLRREAEVYVSLTLHTKDSGCVRLHCIDPSSQYIVLEKHGADLRTFLKPKLKHPLYLARALVEAVLALHECRIMHGNICPANILCKYVTDDNRQDGFQVKLCDLQVAHTVGEYCNAASLGSLYYTAPEVLHAQSGKLPATPSIDIFALGLVVWQILHSTAIPALAAAEHRAAIHQMTQQELHSYLPLPGPDTSFIHRATHLQPRHRITGPELLKAVPIAPPLRFKTPVAILEQETMDAELLRTQSRYPHEFYNRYAPSLAPTTVYSSGRADYGDYGPYYGATQPRVIEQQQRAVSSLLIELSGFYSSETVRARHTLQHDLKRNCTYCLESDEFELVGKYSQLLLDLSKSMVLTETTATIHTPLTADYAEAYAYAAKNGQCLLVFVSANEDTTNIQASFTGNGLHGFRYWQCPGASDEGGEFARKYMKRGAVLPYYCLLDPSSSSKLFSHSGETLPQEQLVHIMLSEAERRAKASGLSVVAPRKFATCTVDPTCNDVVVGVHMGASSSGIVYALTADPRKMYKSSPKFEETAAFDKSVGAAQLYEEFKRALQECSVGLSTCSILSSSGASHSLFALMEHFFRTLRSQAVDELERILALSVKAAQNVRWVVVVPALWTESTMMSARRAAVKAGLVDSIDSDSLLFVTEPESTCMYLPTSKQPESTSLVCYSGDNELSLSAYRTQRAHPLQFQQMVATVGGDHSTDSINNEFKTFLKELLGEEYRKLADRPHIYAAVVKVFQGKARNFSPANTSGTKVDLVVGIKSLLACAAAYNTKHPLTPLNINSALPHGHITLSRELMLSFFEPSLAIIRDQIRSTIATMPRVDQIVLAGSFGNSAVLIANVKAEFNARVRVIPSGTMTLAHGAVLLGLYLCDSDQASNVQVSQLRLHERGKRPAGGVSFAKFVCCPLGDDVTLVAASKGHLLCLDIGLVRYATHPGACTGAARGGHLHCLTRIHEFHAPETPWDEATTSVCAEHGDLPCLAFALDNGCPHTSDSLVLLAARSGNLEMLRDLVDNRSLYMNEDGSVFGAVFEAVNYTCLLYLLDAGCPFSMYSFGGADMWPIYYQVHQSIVDVDARLLLCLAIALARGWTIADGNFAGYMKFSKTLFPNCILYLMSEGLVGLDWTVSGI